MPANKKKKKAVSNPARGVATVSLPSKSQQVETAAASRIEAEDVLPGGSTAPVTSHAQVPAPGTGNSSDAPARTIVEMTPEQLEAHLEDSELQTQLEASRTKSDVTRQVSRLQAERRTLRSQAESLRVSMWLPDQLRDQILEHHAATYFPTQFSPSLIQRYRENSWDLCFKLWTLRQTLKALQFPENETSLNEVIKLALVDDLRLDKDYLWGLQESFEVYCLSSAAAQLPDYDVQAPNISNVVEANDQDDSELRLTSQPKHSPSVVSSSQTFGELPVNTNGSNVDETDSEDEAAAESDESGGNDDPAELVHKWVELKRLSFIAERSKKSSLAARSSSRRTKRLEQKIEKIEKDILFDDYEAAEMWQRVLPDVYEEMASQDTTTEPSGSTETSTRVGTRKTPGTKIKTPDLMDEDGPDVLFGDMFEAPETFQSARAAKPLSSSAENTTTQLIDFGKWSGLHPRRILDETCRQRDRQSKVSLASISSSSFSHRHELLVQWSSNQPTDHWAADSVPDTLSVVLRPRGLKLTMNGIATSTSVQSEAYVSTVALFVISASLPGEQKSFLRLPPVFRDLWQDLNEARQSAIDNHDKSALRDLRSSVYEVIDQVKGQVSETSAVKPSTSLNAAVESRSMLRASPNQDPARIVAEWQMKTSRPAFQKMLHAREQLPVHQEKQKILESVSAHPITIICAETGAGKSTQIPSFILEREMSAGRDCKIMVTQPRRISAISLARRVSEELGEDRGAIGTQRSLVGYAIRLESKVSSTTRITFATTGVLLRILEGARNLDEIDCLILDEVHERSMDLDLLFIAVRRLQDRRQDLKILLMSATVDAEKFSTYFGSAPILNIAGRTFPVQLGYLEDAIEATNGYTRANGLRGSHATEADVYDEVESDEMDKSKQKGPFQLEGYSKKTATILSSYDEYRIDYDLIVKLASVIATREAYAKYSRAILIFVPGIVEIRRLHSLLVSEGVFARDWVVHLLHSTFSSEDLEAAFAIPPSGWRKIVIATNIAETGITIPDITAVIDSCKEKIMRFDDRRQVSRLTEGFISRAASRQRRGRAARVQEGLCFHLVTKDRYDNLMLEQQVPEMLRLSLQDAVLRIKIWDLGAVEETLSLAIDPPTNKNIRRAVEALKDASALSSTEALTPLGRQIARLPLDVGMGKLAILGIVLRCLDAAITITAMLSSKSPFLVSPNQNDGRMAAIKAAFSRGDSELLLSFQAYLSWQNACRQGKEYEFCRKHHLSSQVLSQIEDQKVSLLVHLADAGLLTLNDNEMGALRRARVSRRRSDFFAVPDRFNTLSQDDDAVCAVIAAAFNPKLLLREGKGWRNVSTNQHVSLAPNSIHRFNAKPPKWMSFYQASKTKTGNLIVTETSRVPDYALVLLLGDAEFKLYAGVIVLDGGRVRLSVRDWKTMLALKVLRGKMQKILGYCFRHPGKALPATDQTWYTVWLEMVKYAGDDSTAQRPPDVTKMARPRDSFLGEQSTF